MSFAVYRNYLYPQPEHHRALERLPYRAAPEFLGEFGFIPYKRIAQTPNALHGLLSRMQALVPDQRFNRVFIQRYCEGEFVKPHRDPINNVGVTIIAIFGEFEGAESNIEGETFSLVDGDVLVLDCTINGKQGPVHEVSPVLSGTRYALILNTIE